MVHAYYMKYMSLRSILIAVASAITAGILFIVVPKLTAPQPLCKDCNIIIVSADEFRADDLPCAGYARNTAPNICAFAKSNAYFTNYYSATSYTYDDYVTQMTGLYPSTHHVLYPVQQTLDPTVPTLPKMLRSHGYRTVYVGITSNLNVPLYLGADNGYDEVYTNWFSRKLSPWFDKLLPTLNSHQPTLLYFYSYMLHDPYLPGPGPRKYVNGDYPSIPVTEAQYETNTLPFYSFVLADFESRLKSGLTTENIKRNAAIVKALGEAINGKNVDAARHIFLQDTAIDEQEWYYALWYRQTPNPKDKASNAYLRGLYDEKIGQLDSDLKTLIDYVERPEVKRRTIVVITSDHGDEFGDHGYLFHEHNVYNSSTHVPLIIAAPHLREGQINTLTGAVDLFPTILELVGIKNSAKIDGMSQVAQLLGVPTPNEQRYVLNEHRGTDIQAVTDGTWKLYINRNNPGNPPYELYNLVSDPMEANNVVENHSDVQTRLSQAMEKILNNAPKYSPVLNGFPGWIDGTLRNRLIQTGYF